MERMTHLSLFTGIGGLDLAAEWAGFETVGQCEWADYPTKILEKHWPDVPRWRDIKTLTGDDFFARTGLRTVDVVSGGFPCQPFSVAGKRRGEEDDRYLWPEMLRVIEELRPAWVIGENVAGIVNMALDKVLSDMESLGYACQAFIIPACAVDAPHRRDRVAIVSHRDQIRCSLRGLEGERIYWDKTFYEANSGCENVADTSSFGLYRQGNRKPDDNLKRDGASQEQVRKTEFYEAIAGGKTAADAEGTERDRPITDGDAAGIGRPSNGNRWPIEPDVGRVAHGIPNRVDRLKCLGNAVVPQQFYPIFKAIAEICRMEERA